jgi:hypothetical protein
MLQRACMHAHAQAAVMAGLTGLCLHAGTTGGKERATTQKLSQHRGMLSCIAQISLTHQYEPCTYMAHTQSSSSYMWAEISAIGGMHLLGCMMCHVAQCPGVHGECTGHVPVGQLLCEVLACGMFKMQP